MSGTLQPCLVCGQRTKKVCSRCKGETGIELAFCSPEHQKLVWAAHRLVCGTRSKPFRLPPLTDEDVDVAIAHKDVPCQGVMENPDRSLAKGIRDMLPELKDKSIDEIIRAVAEEDKLPRREEQFVLQLVRAFRWLREDNDGHPPKMTWEMVSHFQRGVYCNTRGRELRGKPIPKYSEVMHRAVVYYELNRLVYVLDRPESWQLAFMKHSEAGLLRFIREDVAGEDPTVASQFEAAWSRLHPKMK
ncbi:hypothetical protein JCM10450v2_003535 [Rhodotorula kratochvilovae]